MNAKNPHAHLDEVAIKRRNIILACENMNLVWDEDQVALVIKLWNGGVPFATIAERLERDSDEVGILIIDLAHHGRISARAKGIFGEVVTRSVTKPIKGSKEWAAIAKRNGIAYSTFRARVHAGMSFEEAATKEKMSKREIALNAVRARLGKANVSQT